MPIPRDVQVAGVELGVDELLACGPHREVFAREELRRHLLDSNGSLQPQQPDQLHGDVVATAAATADLVVEPVQLGLEKSVNAAREVDGVGRRAEFVADDVQGPLAGGQACANPSRMR